MQNYQVTIQNKGDDCLDTRSEVTSGTKVEFLPWGKLAFNSSTQTKLLFKLHGSGIHVNSTSARVVLEFTCKNLDSWRTPEEDLKPQRSKYSFLKKPWILTFQQYRNYSIKRHFFQNRSHRSRSKHHFAAVVLANTSVFLRLTAPWMHCHVSNGRKSIRISWLERKQYLSKTWSH